MLDIDLPLELWELSLNLQEVAPEVPETRFDSFDSIGTVCSSQDLNTPLDCGGTGSLQIIIDWSHSFVVSP